MTAIDVANIRHCYSLTQEALASKTGYTTAYITMIENGQRRVTESVSLRIMAALNIDIERLQEIRRLYAKIGEYRQGG
ncbi:helix-turn-helix transcriptional regulator [Domibacillus indicus]|uniref:helix-turn-helix domain-containing protein n=1 Tax=Domibacillus indicus TaxID=1437523 RepID=UPI0020417AEB|nr:helix-turn-helix transcriptional regulator [Domibacillus indicus]MCM3786893.1 helix-turn-helix transcriptional regulator [Domibacillus indicus]